MIKSVQVKLHWSKTVIFDVKNTGENRGMVNMNVTTDIYNGIDQAKSRARSTLQGYSRDCWRVAPGIASQRSSEIKCQEMRSVTLEVQLTCGKL